MRIATVLLLGLFAAELAWADDARFERKVAADPHGTVEISNVSGTIQVVGWDSPEVEVSADDLGAGVDRIEVNNDHGRTVVKVVVRNHSFGGSSVDLHVHVPRQSELDVSGVSADLTASNVEGVLQLRTVSGGVRTDIFQNNTDIKTVSGDVVVRGHGSSTSMHISTISGDIRVERGAGDLEATTVSGSMTLRLDPAHTVRLRTTSGDVTLEGKLSRGGSIEAESVSGGLTVRTTPEAGLDYEVSAFSGDISNCMGVQAERVSKYGPGRRLIGSKGAVGSDAARVRLKTMSGDVELCDRS